MRNSKIFLVITALLLCLSCEKITKTTERDELPAPDYNGIIPIYRFYIGEPMAAGFILLNAIEQYYADDNKADPAKVLSPDSDMISECQKKLFENACINNIRFREDYNDLLDNSMMACCDVFNALLYYNIIVAWGDFPYAENSSAALDRENAVRNNSRNILTALADDLEKAMACPEDKRYPYDDPDESMSVSKDIARILLADIHMYLGEYSKAGTLLKQVIDSGYYSLEGNGSVILGLYAGIPESDSYPDILLQTYAGVMLSYAECLYVQNDLQDAEDCLKQVLESSGLASDYDDILSGIASARMKLLDDCVGNFAFMKRSGLFSSWYGMDETYMLLPLPNDMLVTYSGFMQNPGY